MKTFRRPLTLLLSFALLSAGSLSAQSPKEQKKAAARSALTQAIENRRYNFIAQNVMPTGGRNRILTTPYSLALKGDTLDADLPYFGRAYTASISSPDAGIRFTTTDFTYSATAGKKQGWEIVLVPKNQGSASRMYLSISVDGYASLSVQSNNRQSINFNGTVAANKRQ